jgi:hypothetical protein
MSDAGFQKFVEILRSADAETVDRLRSDFDPFLSQATALCNADNQYSDDSNASIGLTRIDHESRAKPFEGCRLDATVRLGLTG